MSEKSGQNALNDCFLHDKERLPHHEAISILRSRLPVLAKKETISLADANMRVLAEELTAPSNIPSYDNSAVDGYAFNWRDYNQNHDTNNGEFEIAQRIAAGDLASHEIHKGQAARIFTGARMPKGADSVAMQEDCTASDTQVSIPKGLKQGANCRLAGEDMKAGDTLLSPGHKLRPQDIAAVASTGTGQIEAFTKLRITLFSSGDELLRPSTRIKSEPAKEGQVFDANYFMIKNLAAQLPVTVIDGGILPDNAEAVEAALLTAAKNCDVIITSGGASLGEEDHMVATLDQYGSRHMWQLAIKPGRPMTFGNLQDTIYFGLPGNPVASFVCFLLYVYPALLQMGGGQWIEPKRYALPANFDIPKKKPDRREFYRVTMVSDENGNSKINKFPRDGSGLITGLREANGLAEIPEEVTHIAKGDPVMFIPFSEFGIE